MKKVQLLKKCPVRRLRLCLNSEPEMFKCNNMKETFDGKNIKVIKGHQKKNSVSDSRAFKDWGFHELCLVVPVTSNLFRNENHV